jgi:membrane protein DedA with SNARE-associated domain
MVDWLTWAIETYGYYALLIGTFFEGETIMVLSGFAAQRGLLDLYWVMAVGFCGTFAGDQLYYFIGRHWGTKLLARRPAWQAPADRAYRLLRRYEIPFILSFRFLYGIRSVSPFIIGMSGIPVRRFFLLNLVAAVVWSIAVAALGYFLGHAAELFLAEIKQYEMWLFGGLVALGVCVWIVHALRRQLAAAARQRAEMEARRATEAAAARDRSRSTATTASAADP